LPSLENPIAASSTYNFNQVSVLWAHAELLIERMAEISVSASTKFVSKMASKYSKK
jgi:hypothetical protein